MGLLYGLIILAIRLVSYGLVITKIIANISVVVHLSDSIGLCLCEYGFGVLDIGVGTCSSSSFSFFLDFSVICCIFFSYFPSSSSLLHHLLHSFFLLFSSNHFDFP